MEFSIQFKELRKVHCIYLGVTGYNLQRYCISFFEDRVTNVASKRINDSINKTLISREVQVKDLQFQAGHSYRDS